MVSTHSRLKAAGRYGFAVRLCRNVSTHSRLKAAGRPPESGRMGYQVSTHSRLKAAGDRQAARRNARYGFNTQPPEGGWK